MKMGVVCPPAPSLWSAQAVLAPSLYEATLRSPYRPKWFAPGNVGFFTSFQKDMWKRNGTLLILRVAPHVGPTHAERQ